MVDPQILAREMILAVEHPTAGMVKTLGCPIRMSANPVSLRLPPPLLGEHTDEVLADLTASGMTWPERALVATNPTPGE